MQLRRAKPKAHLDPRSSPCQTTIAGMLEVAEAWEPLSTKPHALQMRPRSSSREEMGLAPDLAGMKLELKPSITWHFPRLLGGLFLL